MHDIYIIYYYICNSYCEHSVKIGSWIYYWLPYHIHILNYAYQLLSIIIYIYIYIIIIIVIIIVISHYICFTLDRWVSTYITLIIIIADMYELLSSSSSVFPLLLFIYFCLPFSPCCSYHHHLCYLCYHFCYWCLNVDATLNTCKYHRCKCLSIGFPSRIRLAFLIGERRLNYRFKCTQLIRLI